MRRNYWKECCLLLIGIFLGTLYGRYLTPYNKTTPNIFIKDTVIIHDTIIKKSIPEIPPLNSQNVLKELIKQEVPCARIVLAQSKLETGEYTSKLCKTHNNIFGLRKGKSYRKYENYVSCIKDYKRCISSRYNGGDYYKFLEKLGYAEDPEYTKKLKNLV